MAQGQANFTVGSLRSLSVPSTVFAQHKNAIIRVFALHRLSTSLAVLLLLATQAAAEMLPSSDDRPLTEADLLGLSAPELRIARNEIFARNGYAFNSVDLTEHFAQYSWYNPYTRNVDLSAVETRNSDFIQRYEQSATLQARLLSPPQLSGGDQPNGDLIEVALPEPLNDRPSTFDPYSRTATAITGPIVASNERVIFFETGAVLDLELVNASAVGEWSFNGGMATAQVFAVSGDAGELLNGNRLCGGALVSFMAVWKEESFGTDLFQIGVFSGTSEPSDINSTGLCGTYSYVFGDTATNANDPNTPVGSTESVAENGAWYVRTAVNALDDSETISLHLTAESGSLRRGDKVSLTARCQSNQTEFYINWNDYLGNDSRSSRGSWKNVTVRLGNSNAQEQRWDLSTDSEATFYPDWAGDFLRRMVTEDRLVVQTTPYNESPVTAVFDIRGLEAGLRLLSNTCNWTF